ncbi:MAG TPA: hydantoinase/oxoprolinase family protein [Solirubrobacteraceae bacterium]|jgi:N-methylhydantoinase A|nr:hydantoinase/oxoprolinase family protein [Solirubrobacteraceae bacterium]
MTDTQREQPARGDGTIRAATDVGGTFTDLVYFVTDPATGEQQVVTAKADTTPPDFERGVLEVLGRSGIAVEEIDSLAHGTTVVINALAERKGVLTGLITTEGFRDSLEIARGNRPDFFNLHYVKPPPFVPRYLRREVRGRLAQDGSERWPLELEGLGTIIEDFRREGVQAIAICLLHSYANPAHERAVLERVRELWPEVSVVASHQITREWREYERTSTAVLSAYVQPIAERYLTRLSDGVRERGFSGQLYIVQSNCGVDSVDKTREIPITMVESGPASGFWGAAELGRLIGEPNVLALDIGGTTAKCSLIDRGEVKIISDYWIERSRLSAGYPILVPVVDLVEIGQGGGSIAWVDDFGKLHVGPQSAGAVPGPAAYGRGGTAATTTDANLALGRIDPDYFCGGEIEADMEAVQRSLDPIADRLGLDIPDAARGIVRIANNNMVNALKLVSLNRGYDPRDFTLVAFGGGGGMHAVALAAELGIRKVVIPRAAEVFSAWGMLMSDLRRDYFVTRLLSLAPDQAPAVGALLAEVIDGSLAQFAEEGIEPERVTFLQYGRLRYENQEHSVEVPLPEGAIDPTAIEQIVNRFHEAYEREYTYRLDAPVEFVGVHVVATAEVGKLEPARLPNTGRSLDDARRPTRPVDYATDGVHEAAIYTGELLEPGMSFQGPAVVETKGTTIVVHPGNELVVDDYGNLHITLS